MIPLPTIPDPEEALRTGEYYWSTCDRCGGSGEEPDDDDLEN